MQYSALILQVFTLIILGLTAYYAWRYAKEAQKSNDLQLMPFFTIVYERISMGAEEVLVLYNLGKGIALNLRIEFEVLPSKISPLNINPISFSLFKSNETQYLDQLTTSTSSDGHFEANALGLTKVHFDLGMVKLKIRISFKDILGANYSQVIIVNEDGIKPHPISRIK